MPEFAINPFTKEPFKVKDLLKFHIYDENGLVKIEGSELQIQSKDGHIIFIDKGETIAQLEDYVNIQI